MTTVATRKLPSKQFLQNCFQNGQNPHFSRKNEKLKKKAQKTKKKFRFGGNIVKSEKIISNIKPHLKKQLKHSKPSTSSSASGRDRFVSCLKERKKKKHKKEG